MTSALHTHSAAQSIISNAASSFLTQTSDSGNELRISTRRMEGSTSFPDNFEVIPTELNYRLLPTNETVLLYVRVVQQQQL